MWYSSGEIENQVYSHYLIVQLYFDKDSAVTNDIGSSISTGRLSLGKYSNSEKSEAGFVKAIDALESIIHLIVSVTFISHVPQAERSVLLCTLWSPPLSGRTPWTRLHQTQPIPVDSLLDFQRTPVDSAMFRYQSGPSPVKWLNGKKWSDWLDLSVHWTSAGLPPDFH